MLEPRKLKYKKIHKPLIKSERLDYKILYPVLGVYGLKSVESGRISVVELNSVKKIILKKLKKRGQVIFNIFPHYSVTAKPQEVRMGKGKGDHKEWVCLVRGGCVLLEIRSKYLLEKFVKNILKQASQRLSIATVYVKGIE